MKVGYYGMNEGKRFEDLKIWKFEDDFRCADILM